MIWNQAACILGFANHPTKFSFLWNVECSTLLLFMTCAFLWIFLILQGIRKLYPSYESIKSGKSATMFYFSTFHLLQGLQAAWCLDSILELSINLSIFGTLLPILYVWSGDPIFKALGDKYLVNQALGHLPNLIDTLRSLQKNQQCFWLSTKVETDN